MDSGPVIAELGNGTVHAHHGPIDLIITIDASPRGRDRALEALTSAFTGLLEELVIDLDLLRLPANAAAVGTGRTAQRMIDATVPLATDGFITPMAAVAGSVADTICDAMWDSDMRRLIVNNGGDIAFRLAPQSSMTVGLADVVSGDLKGGVRIQETDRVRGVATSGRHGRSMTMGVADSVTVFAASAAVADAAATLVASSVRVPESRRVKRLRACDVDANSDLGDRLVVVGVDSLTPDELSRAMSGGLGTARALLGRNLLVAAAIKLGNETATIGEISPADSDTDESTAISVGPMNVTN